MDNSCERCCQPFLGVWTITHGAIEHYRHYLHTVYAPPTILGVFEIIYAAKLLSNPPQVTQPSTTIAILEIVSALVGNFFSVVVGILALVFYNDVTVRDYFARLNGTTSLTPVPPVSAAPPAPILEPASEEPPFPGDETPKS
jgi:hypothetical protein